jgi:hypothetical protein
MSRNTLFSVDEIVTWFAGTEFDGDLDLLPALLTAAGDQAAGAARRDSSG